MTQYAFYLDMTRCTGCRTCEMACKDYKDLSADVAYRKVYDYEGGSCVQGADGTCKCTSFVYHLSLGCQHCENPACVQVCPTGAMSKDSETGIVTVDADVCVGCGYCHMACPYNVPTVDRSLGHSVKCDACRDRVSAGEEPICVQACPLRALQFGPIEEIEKLGERANVAPLPDKSYTDPCLYLKTCDDARSVDSRDGEVRNVLEVL